MKFNNLKVFTKIISVILKKINSKVLKTTFISAPFLVLKKGYNTNKKKSSFIIGGFSVFILFLGKLLKHYHILSIFNYMKNMKHLILSGLIFITLAASLNAQSNLSAEASKYIDSFLDLRVELTQYQKEKSKAVTVLNQYKEKHPYANFSQQEKLIIDSLYSCELFNYVYEDKSYDASLKKELLALINEEEDFIKKNAGNINEWLYIMTADTFSCYMAYSPISGAVKYGLKVKKYYEEAIAINPKNSLCLNHYSQWFYWAPGINGGSKKKTKTYLESALDCAKTNADKFYAQVYYSQILYDLGDKDACTTYLNKAKALYPKSNLITELEEANKEGYSIFTNSRRKAENTKRME